MTHARIPRRVAIFLLVALLSAALATSPSGLRLAGAQGLTCQGQSATIVGTTRADRIVGTPGADVIVALGGADTIAGRGGDDVICSGWGNDTIAAGAGADRVYGGPGSDEITGGDGNDQLFGGAGRDVLVGNSGNDVLNGGTHGDSLMGGLGNDTLKGGGGLDRVVGGLGSDTSDGGAGNDVCAFDDPTVRCEQATLATRSLGPDVQVERVIHISIDGLRSDFITEWLMPNVSSMRRNGVSTLNARTDPDSTKTLPNHTAQFTGRPVNGPQGHGIEFNEDNGGTVHDLAGEYAASVFDVAHDNGLVTGAYVGKEKFLMHERSWSEFGRADSTGADDGRDKIDFFERNNPVDAAQVLFDDLDNTRLGRSNAYIFFHIRLPDSAGHTDGWGSPAYGEAVAESDALVGQIMDHIAQNPDWSDSTGFIITADHGGPFGEFLHSDFTDPTTFKIPFIVSAPGVSAGADLYALNQSTRTNPGTDQVGLTGTQPIRGHEVGNLALDLLSLPAIPGSVFNANQDLRLN